MGLGILEKVNVNLPVKWLSPMLVTMKKDRSPPRSASQKEKYFRREGRVPFGSPQKGRKSGGN